jgi:hypothetical protein
MHGGKTPDVFARAEVRRAVMTYGLPVDINPADALLAEVHRTAGHVAWLAERVRELDEERLTWGVTEEVDRGAAEFTGVDVTKSARPNALLALYQAERAHLVKVCATAISAGIEERRVKLAEAQGVLLAGVIRGILGELALTAEQQARAPEIASRHLRMLASAPAS